MKQISLALGLPAPKFASLPRLKAPKTRIDPGEIGALGKHSRSRFPEEAPHTSGANPPNTHRPPKRKNKTADQRELQTSVLFPASTLRHMTREGIFVKAARGSAPARKWNRGAVEQWLAGPQLEVSWPANDAYGTAHDPDPEIRSHMRAILSGSTKPTAPARA